MELTANWIWRKQSDYHLYNQTIVARKTFRLASVARASLAITADSYYRLFINGEWVNDGPCRSWPEHFQYDVLDVAPYLQAGENEIVVVARYFGEGTFHQVPQQAGLLAQLDVETEAGKCITVATDGSWEAAEAKAWQRNTHGISIQMEPFEHYDARLDKLRFDKAAVLFGAHEGPWQGLNARDCKLLTRHPFALRGFLEANVVDAAWSAVAFPISRLMHPGKIYANHFASAAFVTAATLVAKKAGHVRMDGVMLDIRVNGKTGGKKGFAVKKGENLIVVTAPGYWMQHVKDRGIRFVDTDGYTLVNPVKPGHTNPWCFVRLEDDPYFGDDIAFMNQREPEREKVAAAGMQIIEEARRTLKAPEDLAARFGGKIRPIAQDMIMEAAHAQFVSRRVLADGAPCVQDAGALMHDNPASTTVLPSRQGDVELVYDLGEQNCGYWEFDLNAPAGTTVDIFGIEYISAENGIQHTYSNANGLRYVCAEGQNRFLCLKRRSARYLFVALRNQTGPVSIRNLRLIESTYPVETIGAFSCSDANLNRIWDISARTLKLCMEDSFTDCPLYEQTLWVGDARNEGLFNYTAFGANDLVQRCITIGAQSLERYPIVGCQVPSTWDCLLPAWSFLWGIMVWENYFYSGDKAFLKKTWPKVKKNLKNAEKLTGPNGLFSGPFWNMFDWSGIDDCHRDVLHNSMFVVGAIDAALKCAKVLGDSKTAVWLRAYRKRMVKSINATWDEKKQAYPDSIHDDGTVSESTCMHTSFLALLYDVLEKENVDAALGNMTRPPKGMVTVGSPFAILYLYEALDKAGEYDALIKSIYDNYLPMLRVGATTVWEVFEGGTGAPPGFPTRSHCHAWSSAPIHFLNAIALGLRQTGVGGTAYEVSPRVKQLAWAEGANAGMQGPVKVRWEKQGKRLRIEAEAPAGVKLTYVPNETHTGLAVTFNGRKMG